jgi:hypothetical protein
MKKILIAVLFFVAMSTRAQNVIRIEKPLKLEKVNQGTASDSVLVRGEDKVVKFVPRSSFDGNGGSQDLQSVLNNGTTATIGGSIVIGDGAGEEGGNKVILSPTGQSLILYSYNDADNTNYQRDKISITSNSEVSPVVQNFGFPLDKPSGNYVLTTTDDVDDVYNSIPTKLDQVNTGVVNHNAIILEPEIGTMYHARMSYSGFYPESNIFGDKRYGRFDSMSLGFNGVDGTPSNFYSIDRISWSGNSAISWSEFIFGNREAEGYAQFSLDPNKLAGFYTVATTDDIPIIGTTAPASSTDTGITGEIRVVAGYIYWCVATDTWIRAVGSTF